MCGVNKLWNKSCTTVTRGTSQQLNWLTWLSLTVKITNTWHNFLQSLASYIPVEIGLACGVVKARSFPSYSEISNNIFAVVHTAVIAATTGIQGNGIFLWCCEQLVALNRMPFYLLQQVARNKSWHEFQRHTGWFVACNCYAQQSCLVYPRL